MADTYYIKHRGARNVVEPRKLGVDGLTIMAEQNLLPSERNLPPHFHKGLMEICYFAAGERLYFMSGEMFLVKAGQVFVSWPDEIHWVDSAPYGKALFYYLRLRLPRKPQHFLGLGGAAAEALIEALRTMPQRHFSVDDSLRTLLLEAFGIAGQPRSPMVTLELSLTLARWLLLLTQHARRESGPAVAPDIAEAMRCIDADIAGVDSLAVLAETVGLSTSRFKAKFKRETGLSPWEYVLRKRIAVAKELLRETKRDITRIALDLSFSSSQHFASTFRRFAGCTPTAFRRSGGEGIGDGTYGHAAKWVDEGILHGHVLIRERLREGSGGSEIERLPGR